MCNSRRAVLRVTLTLATSMLIGCMTIQGGEATSGSPGPKTLAGKRVAMLPVKTQTSLAPDSVNALRVEIAKQLAAAVRTKMTGATVSDISTVADLLNQRQGLAAFEQLVQTYEGTGVLDRQRVVALARMLNADLLLLSRLKSEKLDVGFLSKGMGGSLELTLIDGSTAETVWSGSGDWKRGGVLGFGSATSAEAAQGLVSEALKNY